MMVGTIELLGMAVGTVLIIATLSMLWKDNPLFRVGQQAVVGSAIAHAVLLNMTSAYNNALLPMLAGQWLKIIPIILGLFMYTRLKKEYSWMARYSSSLLVGVGTGVMIAGTISGQILDQLAATLNNIAGSLGSAVPMFNALLIAVGTVTGISFFIFTKEHRGAIGTSAYIGRKFLMVSLGANWSGEIVWYLTQLIGRLMYMKAFLEALLGG